LRTVAYRRTAAALGQECVVSITTNGPVDGIGSVAVDEAGRDARGGSRPPLGSLCNSANSS
jgi:hypothetical protein